MIDLGRLGSRVRQYAAELIRLPDQQLERGLEQAGPRRRGAGSG